MNANATYSSTSGMDCTLAARDEVLEAYVSARLTDEACAAFEEHYFGCARCFDELQTLQAVRDELPRAIGATGSRRWLAGWPAVAALAAAVLLAVGAALWLRPRAPDVPATAALEPPTAAARPATSPPAASPAPAVAARPSMAELARFEPPRYEPLTLRGTPDEPTARFQRGMEHYRKGEYERAVEHLRVAADLDADAVHVQFFLGVTYLVLKQDDAAIDRLRRTIALGDSPYLEEAHFYLAKGLLRRNDVAAAETQLRQVIQLRRSGSSEAKRLLTQIQNLKERSD